MDDQERKILERLQREVTRRGFLRDTAAVAGSAVSLAAIGSSAFAGTPVVKKEEKGMERDTLCFLTIAQLSELLQRRAVSPVEVTQAYLERIQKLNPKLNSYLTITTERALQDAKTAETRIRKGGSMGPLDGVPLAHKDIFSTKGIKTTCASKILKDFVPDSDATVMERLQKAGAVLLGKLNMHEFATVSPSVHFGRVTNPWAADRGAGGSSSGSGAAVAAGLCAGSLGTDTAGSIRIPSAMNGTVGLKPTYGRVSLNGAFPLSQSLDHAGPITRSVKDAAILLQAVAGYDPRDALSSKAPVPDYTAKLTGDIRGLTLGVPESFFPEYTDPEVKKAFDAAVTLLSGLGARVEEVALPALDNVWVEIGMKISMPEAYVWHEPYLQKQAGDYGQYVRQYLDSGKAVTAKDYIKAQQARAQLRQDMLAAIAGVDVLLMPGQLIPTPLMTERSLTVNGKEVGLSLVIISTTGPFNITGQPALMMPCGFIASGLPFSLQIVGKPFDEATVLQVGYAYEAHTSWHERRPPVA